MNIFGVGSWAMRYLASRRVPLYRLEKRVPLCMLCPFPSPHRTTQLVCITSAYKYCEDYDTHKNGLWMQGGVVEPVALLRGQPQYAFASSGNQKHESSNCNFSKHDLIIQTTRAQY